MKRFFRAILIGSTFLGAPLVAETAIQEKAVEQELSLFAKDVFKALNEVQEKNRIQAYRGSKDPVIKDLAEKFIQSFQPEASSEDLQIAVSELGRLLKCSADEDYVMPYALNKTDLAEATASMETMLKEPLPEISNYHKLMIESLADEKWDLALYAYFKIAEERAQ